MNMQTILDLFCDHYIQSKEYFEYGVTDDAREALDKLSALLDKFREQDLNLMQEVDDVTGDLVSSYEAQGFCYGFYSAMQILNACGLKVGDVA